MNQMGRVFCRNLIFIAFSELFLTAYANFTIRFALNADLSDDQLPFVGTRGILKNFVTKFALINYDTGRVEYSFDSTSTDIVYMYGDIMVLNQQAEDEADDDLTFHFMFEDDIKCREFQSLLNPTSFQNGEITAFPVQLRLMDETLRSSGKGFPIQSATVLSFHVESLEMEVFMFLDGLPKEDGPQSAYLIVPENGFNIVEPRGKEILLFPSKGKMWKHTLRFKSSREAQRIAGKMVAYSEGRSFISLDKLSEWSIKRYFVE